jgi:hypothetical protein
VLSQTFEEGVGEMQIVVGDDGKNTNVVFGRLTHKLPVEAMTDVY